MHYCTIIVVTIVVRERYDYPYSKGFHIIIIIIIVIHRWLELAPAVAQSVRATFLALYKNVL